MAIKLFQINRLISSSGLVDETTFEVSGIDKIRFVTENAGGTNNFEINVKIKGQSSYTKLADITGNDDRLVDIRTYDLMQINCSTFDGTNITLIGSGFQTGGTIISEYTNFAAFPPATGSGDQAWDVATQTMYYDEPTSQSWVTSTSGSASLTATQIGYGSGGDTLTGEGEFTYNDSTNTMTVENILLNGQNVNNSLYNPESVITLTGTDITNKQITLSATPLNPTKTRLSVAGGIPQTYGDDFTVSGSTLSWNGLGLDGILATGDKLLIEFN